MPGSAKKRMFAEDHFDLDEFKQAQEKKTWVAKYKKQNKQLVNLFTLVIITGTLAIGYFIFVILQYYINLWR